MSIITILTFNNNKNQNSKLHFLCLPIKIEIDGKPLLKEILIGINICNKQNIKTIMMKKNMMNLLQKRWILIGCKELGKF